MDMSPLTKLRPLIGTKLTRFSVLLAIPAALFLVIITARGNQHGNVFEVNEEVIPPTFKEVRVTHINELRDRVLQHVRMMKARNPSYKVIDIGGSASGWSGSVVDALLDKFPPKDNDSGITYFEVNLGVPETWSAVHEYVAHHGKYDFCICTHTLEDLALPHFVVSQMSKIALSGAISTPSRFSEFTRFEPAEPGLPTLHLGWIHHRWIYTFSDNVWLALPKLNFMDHDPFFERLSSRDLSQKYGELNFFWEGNVELQVLNDDFMGPSTQAVVQMFKRTLSSDDFASLTVKPSEVSDCHIAVADISLGSCLRYLRDVLNFHPVKILDVGANQGLWTQLVKPIFPDAHFTLFEANEMHEPRLKATGFPYKIVVLGDEVRRINWYLTPDAHTGSSMFKERTALYDETNDKMTVQERDMSTLDVEVEGQEFQFLKLDTQGSELLVLKGGADMIKSVDVLTLETSVMEYNTGSPLALEMFYSLSEMNFRLLAVTEYHVKEDPRRSFLIQFDIVVIRSGSRVAAKFDAASQHSCHEVPVQVSSLRFLTDYGYVPSSISCASDTCKHWTKADINSLFPSAEFVYGSTKSDVIIASVFPSKESDSLKVLGQFSQEYNLVNIINLHSNGHVLAQMDVLLVRKETPLFSIMTREWLQ